MRIIEGTFHQPKKVAHAVDALLDASIPADDIRVRVSLHDGEHELPIATKRTVGIWGIVAGSLIGGVVGLAVAWLVSAGIISPFGMSLLLAHEPWLTLVRGALAGIAIGFMCGLVLGLAVWRARVDLNGANVERDAASIVVRSDGLHDLARSILEKSGAETVTG